MDLKSLVKPMYTTTEVVARWKFIHEDYDMDFLQTQIAADKINAYIGLSDCFLFPVEEVDNSYQYLELYDHIYNKEIQLGPVHESNEILKDRRNSKKLHVFFSGFIKNKHHTFEKVNETVHTPEKQKPSTGQIHQYLITELDLDSSFMTPKFLVCDSCKAFSGINSLQKLDFLNENNPIIKVTCTLPVTPYFWQDQLGLSFMSPSFINKIKENKLEKGISLKINLSRKNKSLSKKLAFASVIEWNEKFYYVVNKNLLNYEGIGFGCYSLSSDVLRSFREGQNVVIMKEDLEKFEQTYFSKTADSEDLKVTSAIFKDLVFLNQIIEEFYNCDLHTKYKKFKEHRNKGVASKDAFYITDIDKWILEKMEGTSNNLGYEFNARHADLLKKMIVKKYDLEKDARQLNKRKKC